jgi:hypothetical protein
MRALISFFIGLLTAASLVAAIILIAQNDRIEQITFLGQRFDGYVGWDLVAAAGLGVILAFLLLIPGRLASSWRSVGLTRQARELDAKLSSLREEYARLQGEYSVLHVEHEELRTIAASQPLTVVVTQPDPEPAPVVEAPPVRRMIGLPKSAEPEPAVQQTTVKTTLLQRGRMRLRSLASHARARFKRQTPPDTTPASPTYSPF